MYGKNSVSYTRSAGNLFLYSLTGLDNNLYKFFEKHIYFKSITQSASETTRGISFNFLTFRLYYKELFGNTGEHLSDGWLTWFIGFVEGDGAILTYAKNTRVRFVLTQKESAILFYIQNKLTMGTVKHFPQGKSGNKNDFHRLIVDNASHILLLAFLFNGNLAINRRILQLSLWVKALNNRFGAKTIILINSPVKVTLQDGWLSGFTDAEGCFNVSITSNTRYALGNVVKMRYILDQKDKDILIIIKNLFGLGKVTVRSKTDGVYRYTATGFRSIIHVISYFKTFPLITKKAHSFDKWLAIHYIVFNKLHLSEKGLTEVKAIKKQINVNNCMTEKTGSAHP